MVVRHHAVAHRKPFTPSPTIAIVPAISCPKIRGAACEPVWIFFRSVPQIPQVSIRTSTSPVRRRIPHGTGTVSTRTSFTPRYTAARIVVGIFASSSRHLLHPASLPDRNVSIRLSAVAAHSSIHAIAHAIRQVCLPHALRLIALPNCISCRPHPRPHRRMQRQTPPSATAHPPSTKRIASPATRTSASSEIALMPETESPHAARKPSHRRRLHIHRHRAVRLPQPRFSAASATAPSSPAPRPHRSDRRNRSPVCASITIAAPHHISHPQPRSHAPANPTEISTVIRHRSHPPPQPPAPPAAAPIPAHATTASAAPLHTAHRFRRRSAAALPPPTSGFTSRGSAAIIADPHLHRRCPRKRRRIPMRHKPLNRRAQRLIYRQHLKSQLPLRLGRRGKHHLLAPSAPPPPSPAAPCRAACP